MSCLSYKIQSFMKCSIRWTIKEAPHCLCFSSLFNHGSNRRQPGEREKGKRKKEKGKREKKENEKEKEKKKKAKKGKVNAKSRQSETK